MEPIRRDRKYLQAHRVLMRSGLSIASAFAWVFVFQYALGYSGSLAKAFVAALLVYAVSQLVLMVATPLSAAHLRHGVKRALIMGACFAALSFAVLGATLEGYFSMPLGWGILLFGILLGASRALYWIPYRLQASALGPTQSALFELLIALLPAFAGVSLALVYLSVLRLLFGAAALFVISIVPVFFIRDFGEKFEWGYAETFGTLFDARYRTLSTRSILAGVEQTALFIIWPLAVFLIVGGSYFIFGLVMSASLLVTLAVRSVYKNMMRAGFSAGSIPLDVAFAMSGWILRLAAGSPIAIVFADSYSYVSAPSGAPEFLSREHASDAGSYLDEYTALQEVGTALGRIAMCALVACLLVTLPISLALAAALIVAAFAAGITTALSYVTKIRAY